MDFVLIDDLMGTFWCQDDWFGLMITLGRYDDLASSKSVRREDKASTETTSITLNAISSSNSGLCSFHNKPDKHEGYLAYKIRCNPPVIPVEASVIS